MEPEPVYVGRRTDIARPIRPAGHRERIGRIHLQSEVAGVGQVPVFHGRAVHASVPPVGESAESRIGAESARGVPIRPRGSGSSSGSARRPVLDPGRGDAGHVRRRPECVQLQDSDDPAVRFLGRPHRGQRQHRDPAVGRHQCRILMGG